MAVLLKGHSGSRSAPSPGSHHDCRWVPVPATSIFRSGREASRCPSFSMPACCFARPIIFFSLQKPKRIPTSIQHSRVRWNTPFVRNSSSAPASIFSPLLPSVALDFVHGVSVSTMPCASAICPATHNNYPSASTQERSNENEIGHHHIDCSLDDNRIAIATNHHRESDSICRRRSSL